MTNKERTKAYERFLELIKAKKYYEAKEVGTPLRQTIFRDFSANKVSEQEGLFLKVWYYLCHHWSTYSEQAVDEPKEKING